MGAARKRGGSLRSTISAPRGTSGAAWLTPAIGPAAPDDAAVAPGVLDEAAVALGAADDAAGFADVACARSEARSNAVVMSGDLRRASSRRGTSRAGHLVR